MGGTGSVSEGAAGGNADSRPWGSRAESGRPQNVESSSEVCAPPPRPPALWPVGDKAQVQKVEPYGVAGGDQAREAHFLLGFEFRPKQAGSHHRTNHTTTTVLHRGPTELWLDPR